MLCVLWTAAIAGLLLASPCNTHDCSRSAAARRASATWIQPCLTALAGSCCFLTGFNWPDTQHWLQGDPFKTLFVARISYDVTEKKLRKEFEEFGPIKRIRLVHDKNTGELPTCFGSALVQEQPGVCSAWCCLCTCKPTSAASTAFTSAASWAAMSPKSWCKP